MAGRGKGAGFVDDILEKAGDIIFGKDTGVSVGEAAEDLTKRRNRLDDINRQLEDTSPDDTPLTKEIFKK